MPTFRALIGPLIIVLAALCVPSRIIRAAEEPPVLSPLAVVDSVKPDFLAAEAGVLPGDNVVGLDGRENPALEEVLAHYYDYHNARDTKLALRRGDETIEVFLPQGRWGCSFRADFSEPVIRRWTELT